MGFQDAVASAVQTICTSLKTDNNTNTSSLNFYRLDALPDAQPTVSKHCATLYMQKYQETQLLLGKPAICFCDSSKFSNFAFALCSLSSYQQNDKNICS